MIYTLQACGSIVFWLLVTTLTIRTKQFGFFLTGLLLYYYSVYGAWSLLGDANGSDSGMRYHYLQDKLFYVRADGDYFSALLLYFSFIIGVIGTALAFTRGKALEMPILKSKFTLNHKLILGICFLSGALSLYLIKDEIAFAALMNISGYEVLSDDTVNPYITISKFFRRLALFPAFIGLASLLTASSSRFFAECKNSETYVFIYCLFLLIMGLFSLITGDKHELFISGIGGLVFYCSASQQVRYSLIAVLGASLVGGMALIEGLRGLAISELTSELESTRLWNGLEHIATSNEAFAPHMSLYGILRFDLPIQWGESFISLIASIVPRMFWPSRPEGVYEDYVRGVFAVEGQGYTIHHAAGWYLNFGVIGPVIGGILFGALLGFSYRSLQRCGSLSTVSRKIFAITGFSSLVACVPSLCRAGIEDYKPLGITIAINWLVIRLAVLNSKRQM